MTQFIASNPNRPAVTAHRAKSRLVLLWLVVALLCQGFVTQTHVHFGTEQGWTAAGPVRATVAAADDQKRSPATPACPLCEEKALFGAYLLGGSITIAASIDAVYQYAATSLPLLALRLTSHAWRSRAPPIFAT